MAECDSRLPRSTTIAEALVKIAIQPGSVWRATRISPLLQAVCMRGSRTTRATAVTMPLLQPVPLRSRPHRRLFALALRGQLAQADDCRAAHRSAARPGSGRVRDSAISALAQPRDLAQVVADGKAFDGAEHFLHREVEDVVGLVDQAVRVKLRGRPRGRDGARGRRCGCARSADSRGRGPGAWPSRAAAPAIRRRTGRPGITVLRSPARAAARSLGCARSSSRPRRSPCRAAPDRDRAGRFRASAPRCSDRRICRDSSRSRR